MFVFALQRVRAAGVDEDGRSNANLAEITRLTWERFRDTGGIVHADALNATKRAISAREGGWALTENPNTPGALRAKEYAPGPHIDRRRGEYEWRVVVRGTGAGNAFETMVIVRSRTRLAGAEIIDEATQMFTQGYGLERQATYRNQVNRLGESPEVSAWIIAASRNPP